VAVGQALGLDVTRPVQVPLGEALAAAERRHRFADRGLVLWADLVERACDLQPAPTAAERGLDGDGQAVLPGELGHVGGTGHRLGRAWYQWRTRVHGDMPCAYLVTKCADGGRWRPDPGQARVEDRLREVRVLREEPVAGVDRVGPGLRRRLEELRDVQIGVGGGPPAEPVCLVRHHDVQPIDVGFRVDGNTGQIRIATGAGDSDRDLAAVSDEDFAHGTPPLAEVGV
jgi:hypothetical protein